MRWPWSRREQQPSALSLTDPALVALLTPGGLIDGAGVSVGETSALGLSALWRALMLVSGTLASLPLNTWSGDGASRKKVTSVFDEPDGPDDQTPYEWKETLFLHLMMHGRAGALKVRTAAGGVARLALCHPITWRVVQPSLDEQNGAASTRMPRGGVWFDLTLNGATMRLDAEHFWYVPGPSIAGQNGMGLLGYARESLGTAIAGDRAAAKVFSSGALISGMATPVDDTDLLEDVTGVRNEINRAMLGYENAGSIAIINRRLQFTPWTMTAQQAQFLESRQFQVEEIARWTGVPPHLLMQTDKQTSWGTGVDEQNRGLSRFVLGHWASRVEQRGSRLLARPRWCEFDFAGLERPNFATEVELLLKQTGGKPILTQNEARAVRNLAPVEGGDVLNAPAPEPSGEPDPPTGDKQGSNDDPATE